ncbi:BRCA1 protein [Necator americanus]|uniref:BRCA1 protein n=1 Tax=Necator americanus TaxID=51031 RepID=W2TX47_NECAM|nr:BRCA1 protein [Necator americanus]ETN85641.1 BRCA1 protein [Necator americanus]
MPVSVDCAYGVGDEYNNQRVAISNLLFELLLDLSKELYEESSKSLKIEVRDLCSVHHSTTGAEYINESDVVFLFEEFESEIFRNFISSYPHLLVFGLTLLKSRVLRNLPLPRPKPNRPLYCDMLRNFNVVIGYGDENERRNWIKMIRYMGGHIRKEPDPYNTFLVTTQARGRAFRMLVSLGQKVLLPSWVDDCWSNRNDFSFDPTSDSLLLKHRIGVFESLQVYVVGFEDDDAEDIKNNILSFKGAVTNDLSSATHLVVNFANECKFLDSLSIASNQRVVTAEWVWTSISIQYCANEDAYAPFVRRIRSPVTTTGQSLVLTVMKRSCFSKDGTNVVDETSGHNLLPKCTQSSVEAQNKDTSMTITKAHYVCTEMLETEFSYLKALKLLESVKKELESAIERGDTVMEKADVLLVFGKISPILQVHEKIVVSLKQLLDKWDEKTVAVKVSQVM